MATTTSPGSTQDQALLKSVSQQLYSRIRSKTSLSMHFVHAKPSEQENSNAYVNLARLFAETDRVALFPQAHFLRSIEAHVFHSLFAKHTSHWDHEFKPAIVTASGNTSFPFSAFSPVLIRRDDSMWCDERFALWNSGVFAWQECLWQLWIARYGSISTLLVPEATWPEDNLSSETDVRVSAYSLAKACACLHTHPDYHQTSSTD